MCLLPADGQNNLMSALLTSTTQPCCKGEYQYNRDSQKMKTLLILAAIWLLAANGHEDGKRGRLFFGGGNGGGGGLWGGGGGGGGRGNGRGGSGWWGWWQGDSTWDETRPLAKD